MPVRVDVELDSEEVKKLVNEVLKSVEPTRLLKLIGVKNKSWIIRNFKAKGRLNKTWAPLKESTIEARRQGSSSPLQDTGHLRRSFESRILSRNTVEIGSDLEIAKYHEEGTKGPYRIAPRNKKYLTIPSPLGKVFSSGALAGKRGFFAKEVMHPGLVARPMLPSKHIAEKLAIGVIQTRLKAIK